MSTNHLPQTDAEVLDLLREQGPMSISDFASSLGVTQTAVRQRLTRLVDGGFVSRRAKREGRGRPSYRYELTQKGRRKTGANFADLAVALWREIRSIPDPEIRRGLLQRIADRMASEYSDQVTGATLEDRMKSVSKLFGQRDVAISVTQEGGLPVLSVNACPYPDLAEQDRTICSMEKMLFSELLGEGVRLSNCRLDGAGCCTFENANS